MRFRRRATTTALAALAGVTLLAACSSGGSSTSGSSGTTAGSTAGAAGETTIGVDLTYNSTAFWAAYINYESQYAKQLHIKLLGIIFAVFAAAVIGGVSLQGGRGNMVGAASGMVLLGVVQNILDLENAPNYWIDAIDGAVILVALILARVIGGEASAE